MKGENQQGEPMGVEQISGQDSEYVSPTSCFERGRSSKCGFCMEHIESVPGAGTSKKEGVNKENKEGTKRWVPRGDGGQIRGQEVADFALRVFLARRYASNVQGDASRYARTHFDRHMIPFTYSKSNILVSYARSKGITLRSFM